MIWFHVLSVKLVHCAQMALDIDTISYAYNSSMSLSDRVKIWLTLVYHFLPKFCPKSTQHSSPFDSSIGDIWWQIVAGCLEIALWSQWTAYRKPLVPSLTPSPKMSIPNAPITTNSMTCWHLANMIEGMSPFARLLWPLFKITVICQPC